MNRYFKIFFRLIVGCSVLALVMVYFFEYYYDLTPCKLCLQQRWPFFIVIVLGLIGHTGLRIKKILSILIALTFAVSVALSTYQVSMENGWFTDRFQFEGSCSSSVTEKTTSVEQFKANLMSKDIVTCDQTDFEIFGLTLAAWNMIYSMVLFLFSAILAISFFRTGQYEG